MALRGAVRQQRNSPLDTEGTRLPATASPWRAWGSRLHARMRPRLGVAIWGHRRCVWAVAEEQRPQCQAHGPEPGPPHAARARDLARRQRDSVPAGWGDGGCAYPKGCRGARGSRCVRGCDQNLAHGESLEGALSPLQPRVSWPRTPDALEQRGAHGWTWVPGLRGRFFIQKDRRSHGRGDPTGSARPEVEKESTRLGLSKQ